MQDKNIPNSEYPTQDGSPEIATSKKRKRGEQEQDDSQGQQQAQPQDQRLAASSSSSSSSSSNQDKIDNPPAKRQKTNSSDEEGIDITDADSDYEDQMEVDLPRAGLNAKSKEIERIYLKEFYFSEIRYLVPTKENFKKFVDLAARYINGEVTIISAGAKSHHRAIFVAAILENKSHKSAQTYLKIIKRDSEIVKELATDFILRLGTIWGLDCVIKLGVDLRKINPQNLQGQNILEVASKNPDQLAMLKHVMKIIGNEEVKKILHGHNSNSFLSIVNSAMQVGSFDIVKMLIEFIPQDQMENYSRGFHGMNIVNYAAQCKDDGAMLRLVVDLIGRDLAKKLALPSCIGNSDSCSYSGIFSAHYVGNIQGLKFLLELFSPDELFAWRNLNHGENILMHALHYSNNLELLKILADKLGGEKAAKLVDVCDLGRETLRSKVIKRGDEKAFDFLSSLTPDWTNDPKLVYEILRYAELINQKIYQYIVDNYYSVKGDELESVGKVYEEIKRNNSGQQSVQNPVRNMPPQPPMLGSAPNHSQMGNMPPQPPRFGSAPNHPPMGNMPPQPRPVSGPNHPPMGSMPPQPPMLGSAPNHSQMGNMPPQPPRFGSAPNHPPMGNMPPQPPRFGSAPNHPPMGNMSPQPPRFGSAPNHSQMGNMPPQPPRFGSAPNHPPMGNMPPQPPRFGSAPNHPPMGNMSPQPPRFGSAPNHPPMGNMSSQPPRFGSAPNHPPMGNMSPQPPRFGSAPNHSQMGNMPPQPPRFGSAPNHPPMGNMPPQPPRFGSAPNHPPMGNMSPQPPRFGSAPNHPPMGNMSSQPPRFGSAPNHPPMGNMPPQPRPVSGPNHPPMGSMPPQPPMLGSAPNHPPMGVMSSQPIRPMSGPNHPPMGNMPPQPPRFGSAPNHPPMGNMSPQPPRFGSAPNHPPMGNMSSQPPRFGSEPNHPPMGNMSPQPPRFGSAPNHSQMGSMPPQPPRFGSAPNHSQMGSMPPQPPMLGSAPNHPPMGNMPPQPRPVSGPNHPPMGNMPPQPLSSSSPTVAPLASSSNVVAAAQQAPLAQTGMSSLELFNALEQSLLNGPETAVSAKIKDNLQVLKGLIIGHQAVVDIQKPNDSHSRNI